jgi:hypothetical protein
LDGNLTNAPHERPVRRTSLFHGCLLVRGHVAVQADQTTVNSLFMKTILIVILLAFAFSGGACSRSDKPPDAAVQTAPNPNLKSDADRLQQATAKAAEERKRAQAQGSATPSAPQP